MARTRDRAEFPQIGIVIVMTVAAAFFSWGGACLFRPIRRYICWPFPRQGSLQHLV